MIFTEVKIYSDSTVRYSMERMVVMLQDCNQTDLANKLQSQYEVISDAMAKAEKAASNHEYQLYLLTAYRESKGLQSLVQFLHTYQVIPILEDDIHFLRDYTDRIDIVRRSTKKNRIAHLG
ncbi:MAG: hypothetical protein U0U66_01165 [Cytophagaceae bacterium]